MRILCDGVDGTGKSTLVKFLSEKLGKESIHFSYPKTDDAFMEFAPSYTSKTDGMIFDRCWISEIIYGKLKGRPAFSEHDINFFKERTKNDLYIFTSTDFSNVEKVFAERGEDYIDSGEAMIVARFFDTTAKGLVDENHRLTYDFMEDGQDLEGFLARVQAKIEEMTNKDVILEKLSQETIQDESEIENTIETTSKTLEAQEDIQEIEPVINKDKKVYNTTDLDPKTTFERHVYHRDQFAHFLRWSFVLKLLKEVRGDKIVCDFGCGKGNLYEVLYRNRFSPKQYFGLDIRKQTIEKAQEKFQKATFIAEDLITLKNGTKLEEIQADFVTSFEVIEHVGKQNALTFLKNFMLCGNQDATYILSTPNYDSQVGAADNHTYPDYEGGEAVPQEFDHGELMDLIEESGFVITERIGTFASIRDYKDYLEVHPEKKAMFEILRERLDSNVLSVVMAPLVPAELARNCMWVLKRR